MTSTLHPFVVLYHFGDPKQHRPFVASTATTLTQNVEVTQIGGPNVNITMETQPLLMTHRILLWYNSNITNALETVFMEDNKWWMKF